MSNARYYCIFVRIVIRYDYNASAWRNFCMIRLFHHISAFLGKAPSVGGKVVPCAFFMQPICPWTSLGLFAMK